jgi:hypothetical protein
MLASIEVPPTTYVVVGLLFVAALITYIVRAKKKPTRVGQ